MHHDPIDIDALILGGGVCGLWLMHTLRRAGYSCVLVSRGPLGNGQTIASQGIIHGGIKYALTGRASSASKAIAGMPEIWRASLAGSGEIDLRGVKVLTPRQYLWTTGGVGSRLMGAAASKVIRTAVVKVGSADRPPMFSGASSGINIYQVDEPVLDPASLVRELARLSDKRAGDGSAAIISEEREIARHFRAKVRIAAAGEGNAFLCNDPARAQQVRPLEMLMLRSGGGASALGEPKLHLAGIDQAGSEALARSASSVSRIASGPIGGLPELPMIYGHCISGLSDKPRVTITSQRDTHGRVVWYIGGQIAERTGAGGSGGGGYSRIQLMSEARRELAACLPWVDFAIPGLRWSTLLINRAEGRTAGGARPDEPVVRVEGQTVVVWPTKLALAPLAAARALDAVKALGIVPSAEADRLTQNELEARVGAIGATPRIAALPWDEEGRLWT